MSTGSQIDKFYQEVSENQFLWYCELPNGEKLGFDVKDGNVSFPIWSSRSRIQRLKKLNPKVLGEVEAKGISLEGFNTVIVPSLVEKQRLVNLNLSGKNLTGFNLDLRAVLKNLESIKSAS